MIRDAAIDHRLDRRLPREQRAAVRQSRPSGRPCSSAKRRCSPLNDRRCSGGNPRELVLAERRRRPAVALDAIPGDLPTTPSRLAASALVNPPAVGEGSIGAERRPPISRARSDFDAAKVWSPTPERGETRRSCRRCSATMSRLLTSKHMHRQYDEIQGALDSSEIEAKGRDRSRPSLMPLAGVSRCRRVVIRTAGTARPHARTAGTHAAGPVAAARRAELVGRDGAVAVPVEAGEQLVDGLRILLERHLGVAVGIVELEAPHDPLVHGVGPERLVLLERERAVGIGVEGLDLLGGDRGHLFLGDLAVARSRRSARSPSPRRDRPVRPSGRRTAGRRGVRRRGRPGSGPCLAGRRDRGRAGRP